MKKNSQEILLPTDSAQINKRSRAGFSLIELLVVLAIIAILATLSGPSLVSSLKGSALSQGGQMIQDQLTLYRQLALNNNYIVEARIYNFIDSGFPGDTGHYRGIQAFKVIPTLPLVVNTSNPPQIVFNKTAITKALRLPPSVIIDKGGSIGNSSNISYLIKLLGSTPTFYSSYNLGPTPSVAPQVPLTGDPSLFNVGTNYTYVCFQFNPDGSTNLAQTIWGWSCYLTLHAINKNSDDAMSNTTMPKNYYTIQIDPNNGRVYTYRP